MSGNLDNRANLKQHGFEPRPVQELDVRFDLESAHKAIPAFRELPMTLAGNGEYVMEVKGTTLHVYETSGKGIKKFDFTDSAKGGEFESEEGQIMVGFKGGTRIDKIALHTAPAPKTASAIDPHFLPLQDDLIEARGIKNKGDQQTADDKKRLADIIRQVQARAKQRRTTIPVPKPEGERDAKELAKTQELLERSEHKVKKLQGQLERAKEKLETARNNQYSYRPSSSG